MISKLYALMFKIGIKSNQDKVLHALAGFAIALSVALLSDAIFGLIAGLLAGAAKEAYDEYSYGGADFFDFFATLLGTVVGVFTYGIIG